MSKGNKKKSILKIRNRHKTHSKLKRFVLEQRKKLTQLYMIFDTFRVFPRGCFKQCYFSYCSGILIVSLERR